MDKFDVIVEKLENPKVRWAVVFLGVAILWRFKLHLFAVALPVMAYWHFSQQSEEGREQQQDGEFDDEPAPARKQQDFENLNEEFGDDDDDPGFTSANRDLDRLGSSHPTHNRGEEDMDPYGENFWGSGNASPDARRNPPQQSSSFSRDDDNDFLFGGQGKKAPSTMNMSSWDDDPSGGPLGDDGNNLKGLGSLGNILGGGGDFLSSFGKDNGDGMDFQPSFDFGGGDMDFLTESMGSNFGRGGGGKGKGKGKKGDREGKGEKGPRENDPKQVFVANVHDKTEDELREFFSEKGEIERLKILTDRETGDSKGVCFVTFATEEQAQDALMLNGTPLPSGGKGILVRPAGDRGDKGGNRGDKGDRGSGKGKDRDKGFRRDDDRDGFGFNRSRTDPTDDREQRFGGLGDDRESRPKGGKAKGGGRNRQERSELDELIEEELANQDNIHLRAGDFDYAAKRLLGEIRKLDRSNGTERFAEAIAHVVKYSNGKEDRNAVRKWTAYVYTLLKKVEPDVADNMEPPRGRTNPGNFRD